MDKLTTYFKDCFKIINIIINTLVYGNWKERKQILKDMVNVESWLYE